MSDTPRTDAKTQFFGWNPEEGEEFVTANFVRELERENAALRAEALKTQIGQHAEIKNYAAKIAELERQNAALREALIIEKERMDWIQNLDCDSHWSVHLADSQKLRASIYAARKEAQP